MNAGIELDILIAEKIFGLEVVKNKSGSKRGGFYYSVGEPDWDDFYGDMQLANPVPIYSLDIATAWEVVEKLFELGWDCEVSMYRAEQGPRYRVDVRVIEHQEHGATEFADTAPLAICLAALKALE